MTDRHTVDTINSDQLDQLYDRIEKLAQTIAAFPDANDAANLAHARAQRDDYCGRAARAEEEVKRLGLMVDEYGAGASALTDKIKRARAVHRETCPFAQGKLSDAFTCSMCAALASPGPAATGQPTCTATWTINTIGLARCAEPADHYGPCKDGRHQGSTPDGRRWVWPDTENGATPHGAGSEEQNPCAT